MDNGWIKLHRKITKKGYYKKSQYVHLWIHLLLNVNHKQSEFMWNSEIIHIKEGQLLTGRKQLSKETGISESSIERILQMLENEHQIEQQKTTKFRIITVINWKNYQIKEDSGQQNEQQADNRRTTSGQQTDTNKNIKKDKKEKKKDSDSAVTIKPDNLSLVKSDSEDIVTKLINAFENAYESAKGFPYLNNNNGAARSAMGKLLAVYKKKNKTDTEQTLKDFTGLFNAICQTNYGKDYYHAEIDICKVGSHINQYIQIINKNNITDEKRYNAIFG